MKTRLLAAAMLTIVATPVLAADLSYDNIEVRYSSLDIGSDGDGFDVRGSYRVHENIYLFGQYAQSNFDVLDINSDVLVLGAGYRLPVRSNVDFVAELNLERNDIDFLNPVGPGRLSGSDNGFGLSGGLRGMIREDLELSGKLRYLSYGNGANDFLVGIGAAYAFNARVGLIGGYEAGDVDALSIGLRINF